MSQTPKKKQNVNRRLTVEMMESRLMLSISPTGPSPLRDLVEVEFVPPPSEGAEQIDMLDFSDIASQFNSTHISEQNENTVPVRALPPEDAGALNLEDPSNFLSASTADNVSQNSFSLVDHLTDEYTPISWDSSASADQAAPPTIVVTVPLSRPDAPTGETTLFDDGTDQAIENTRETFDSSQSGEEIEGDFTLFYAHPSKDSVLLGSTGDYDTLFNIEIKINPEYRGEYGVSYESVNFLANVIDISENIQSDHPLKQEDIFRDFGKDPHYQLTGDLASILSNNNIMFSIDGLWVTDSRSFDAIMALIPSSKPIDNFDMPSNFGGDFADTYVNSFYISDAYSAWNMAMSSVYGDSRGFSIYGSNSWETQMPPSARAFNPDTLRIMASTLYQDLYYNSDSSINNLYSTDSQYLATIDSYTTTTSRPLTNSNSEEGLYTEGSSFIEFGGSDGTTVELDVDELAILESQGDLDSAGIEGLANTNSEVMLVDDQSNAEEGGMIDFSAAMNWAQAPVAATAEGIVQASVQQDQQIAFEGLYGRGQTFELATAEEEAANPEDPNLQEVSAALLKELNNMSLKSNAQENLDKSDATLPTEHEMALNEVNNEMDYASMLPGNVLSWATFAFVTQSATRHPDERKKKK